MGQQPFQVPEYVQINLFCQASIMLCELLEATAENPSSPDVATDDSAIDAGSHQEGDRRDELQDDSPARVSVVARNISKLRLESGLSYEKLATLVSQPFV